MAKLTKADRAWIINRLIDESESAMMADADSADDKRFSKLEAGEVVTCYDSMFESHYYSFTQEGRRLVIGRPL